MVFRAAQEAIRNVGSHAAARHVDISVAKMNGTVTLCVTDDGRGFDDGGLKARRAEGHMGLVMLRDLAEAAGGTLAITSAPGAGTTVELDVEVP